MLTLIKRRGLDGLLFDSSIPWRNLKISPLSGSSHHKPSQAVHLDKVLIANRGEITCRIIRSARKMGIKTVSVFSDADKGAMHVRMADEAFHIGPPPSQQSYLVAERIIQACKATGAQAVHPGYGFLSQSPEFADLCVQEGIIWIGPPASAIRDMGIKSTSKHIMSTAGVPVITGYHGDDQSLACLREAAENIGYPVMLKAVRGGGGKGMRVVNSPAEFETALESARRESLKAFNDDVMLVEKFIERPRHIEVQVFADQFGNTVYLYERDCSVQRRHQKIIEEAPAPGLSFETRRQIGEAACRAAKAVGYVSAGTVEFILDRQQKFYFMEMNTRLQVEHPVSEMVTGLDIVEMQLRVARGEPLSFKQDQIPLRGHSFEARIYAEDPDRNFVPCAGPLLHLRTPKEAGDVRIETGVEQGDQVSVFYDPMIAKLVVWGHDRQEALRKLRNHLVDYQVVGLPTNIGFLHRLASHPAFIGADVHTGFIPEHQDVLLGPRPQPSDERLAMVSIGILLSQQGASRCQFPSSSEDKTSPFQTLTGFRLNDTCEQLLQVVLDGKESSVLIQDKAAGMFTVKIRDIAIECEASIVCMEDTTHLKVLCRKELLCMPFCIIGDTFHFFTKDGCVSARLAQPKYMTEGSIQSTLSNAAAPMTGTIEKILVASGDFVKEGQPLAILEAMKMEHVIRAPRDGCISAVLYSQGQTVERNALLFTFKE